MLTEEMSERLDRIQAGWLRAFEEELPFGFDVSWGDLDVLEQCLEEGSQRPLNAVLKERHVPGRHY